MALCSWQPLGTEGHLVPQTVEPSSGDSNQDPCQGHTLGHMRVYTWLGVKLRFALDKYIAPGVKDLVRMAFRSRKALIGGY